MNKKLKILYILISLFLAISCRKKDDNERLILNEILTELSKNSTKEFHSIPPIPNSTAEEKLRIKSHNESQKLLKPILVLSDKFVSSSFFNNDNHINSESIESYNLSETENILVEKLLKSRTEKQIPIDKLNIKSPVEILFEKEVDSKKHRIIEFIYISEILIEKNYACLYYQYGGLGIFRYGSITILKKENGVWNIERKLFNWIT